jgi:hypothetical protein
MQLLDEATTGDNPQEAKTRAETESEEQMQGDPYYKPT